MRDAQVEYLGFTTEGAARQYALRVRQPTGEVRDFKLAIPIAAFEAGRVRFQDAPEICFAKLQRALAASSEPLPVKLGVSGAELEDHFLHRILGHHLAILSTIKGEIFHERLV